MSPITRQLKKPWVVMPLVAVLAVGGWLVLRPDASADEASGQAEPQVVEATVGTMSRTVTADGTVAAAETEDLSFAASGTVTAVNVEAGDEVTEGQVLAQLDSVQLEADVATAEASVADAEAKLADDTDADASDAQLQADRASLTSAQDQLDAAEEALDGATLVAGFDGTVSTVDVTVGEKLADGGAGGTALTGSASGSGSSSSTLGTDSGGGLFPGAATTDTSSTSTDAADISIVSAGRFVVELGFDDADIANVAVGQVATISTSSSSSSGFPGGGFPGGGFPGLDQAESGDDDAAADGAAAAPDLTATTDPGVEGLVTEVGSVADASSGVAEYPVTVAFTDDSGELNVGATVSVEIAYEEVEDAIQVPSFAVTTTDGASTVQVQTGATTETRTVETGLTSGTMVQITDGLAEGESVVIEIPALGDRGGDAGGGGTDSGGGGLPEGFTPPAGFTPPNAGG
jgi:multidrug efflux pump subunit AcrA (membrane-fusion protein)